MPPRRPDLPAACEAPSPEKIALSSDEYRDMVENLSEGIYRSTPGGRVLLANRALANMLGYSVEELLRKDITRDVYLDPKDREQNLRALAVDGFVFHYGLKLRKKNGDVILVEETSRAVHDDSGNVIYYEGIIEDVTERRSSEREARYFRDLFEAAVENVSDGVIHLALDGTVQYVNSVIEVNTLLKREQIIGKHFSDVWPHPPTLPHEKYRTWAEAFEAVVETRKPVALANFPIRYRNPRSAVETAFALRMVPQIIDGQLRGVIVFVEYFTEQLRLQQQILQSEARYRSLVENASEAIWTVDTEGRFASVNQSFERMTGRTQESLIGVSFWEAGLIAPEFVDLVRFQFQSKMEGAPGRMYEIEIVDAAGNRVPAEITSQLLYVEGRLSGVLGIGRDIRERKKLERELLSTRNHLQSIFDNALDGIIATDAAGIVVGWNRGAERIFELGREEMLGQSVNRLFPQDQGLQLHPVRRGLMCGEAMSDLEVEWKRPDGKLVYLNVSISPIRDETGKVQGASAIARDITERKKLEVALQHLVITDHLTETYNRYYFDQLLEKELARSQRSGESLSVISIDIDGFKEINDRYGHLVGDRVLQESARILKTSLRNSDTLVRYGGDEFLILLPETDQDEIPHVVRRIEGKLKHWNESETFLDCALSFSVGCATCEEGRDFEKSLKIADQLMYENKNRKRDALSS
ncbi:MAG: PAS domain S-box protein [Acidobacteria bacterium]|nr:PAS domain S-box protein [Acidobacteriota bacterium]